MKLSEAKLHDLYRQMPWRLLDDSLNEGPRGGLVDLARYIGLDKSTVSRWRRAYEEDTDTGARSALEITLLIFSWWLLHTPEFCLIFIQILQTIYDEHRLKFIEMSDPAEGKKRAIDASCQLMQAIANDADSDEIERLLASVIHHTKSLACSQKLNSDRAASEHRSKSA